MSTEDKLAETIRNPYGSSEDGYRVDPHSAAARVREAFVVIDRDDLPEVVEGRYARVRYGDGTFGHVAAGPNDDPEWHEAKAKLHLAVAEHLRANPPVDEKAVEELAFALDQAFVETGTFNTAARDAAARALVADGWKRGGVS